MSDAAEATALQVAHRVRDGMRARDRACQARGMRVVEVTPGRASLAKSGRMGIYDIEVSNQNGVRTAVFRGRSHNFRGRPAVPQAKA